uniref:Uncharacterized protein n=1 Tax=Anguilla anguilla TaxID=7936 RepID=A0A0E9VYV7_ANGAN
MGKTYGYKSFLSGCKPSNPSNKHLPQNSKKCIQLSVLTDKQENTWKDAHNMQIL